MTKKKEVAVALSATYVNLDMGFWAPLTKLYAISDGTFVAVEVPDMGFLPEQISELAGIAGIDVTGAKHAERPTVIVACNDEGIATDLTPLNTFPYGTSFEDALTQAGYVIA